jgi:hypothetical protein
MALPEIDNLSPLQLEVMLDAARVYPRWFRARRNGERVTLNSLWRRGLMQRRDRTGRAGTREYRPTGQWINAAHTRGLLGAAAPTPSPAAPSGKE